MMIKNKGFSFVELMVAMAIIGVIAGIAVPTASAMIQRNQLKNAVQSFQDDLQFARVQAIKKSVSVIVSRTSGAAGAWCYGLASKIPSSKTSCDCTVTDTTNSAYCDIKIVSGANYGSVTMNTETGNNSTFDFRRGTVGADGVTFYTANYSARVMFSDAGRARICAPTTLPSGTTALVSSC